MLYLSVDAVKIFHENLRGWGVHPWMICFVMTHVAMWTYNSNLTLQIMHGDGVRKCHAIKNTLLHQWLSNVNLLAKAVFLDYTVGDKCNCTLSDEVSCIPPAKTTLCSFRYCKSFNYLNIAVINYKNYPPLDTTEPVSYPHLDVYKRQHTNSA